MTEQSKLEWTEYKSRFRAITAYGTYWVDTAACSAGYQLICGTNPCCVVFSSPQEAKAYAQTIHDRPSSRDDWFNLSDVEQAPYHAPVDLSDLLQTYETLLAGDNLAERIAVQTVDLRALLAAAKPVDVAAVLEATCSINIHEEANSYEWRGEGGDYTPQSHEKAMLEDFGHGLISLIEDAIRALSPAASALAEHWQDISSFGERELGRLIVVGAFDGKGRLCATVRRLQQPIGCHSNSPASLKKAMRLKWEPTHFMELTAPTPEAGK